MKRRFVLAPGVGAGVGVVLGAVGFWGMSGPSRRKGQVDKEAVETYFPALGPLVEAHLTTSRDGEADGRSLPSPDLFVTALLRLKPGKAGALVAHGDFTVVDTDVSLSGFEKGLSNFLPTGAKWQHSEIFDGEVCSKFDDGQCYLDTETDLALVRTVNPTGASSPTATAGPTATSKHAAA